MNSNKLNEHIAKIPAGFLDPELFNQIARLGVLTYIELIAFRQMNNAIEVLLTKREPSDKFWPNMYHNPGTVLRPSDQDFTFADAIQRLESDEYKTKLSEPNFAGFWFEQLERGKGFGVVSWVELNDCPAGEYFDINNLPSNLIKGQATYIQKAAQQYINYKCSKFNPTPLSQLILQ